MFLNTLHAARKIFYLLTDILRYSLKKNVSHFAYDFARIPNIVIIIIIINAVPDHSSCSSSPITKLTRVAPSRSSSELIPAIKLPEMSLEWRNYVIGVHVCDVIVKHMGAVEATCQSKTMQLNTVFGLLEKKQETQLIAGKPFILIVHLITRRALQRSIHNTGFVHRRFPVSSVAISEYLDWVTHIYAGLPDSRSRILQQLIVRSVTLVYVLNRRGKQAIHLLRYGTVWKIYRTLWTRAKAGDWAIIDIFRVEKLSSRLKLAIYLW